MVDVKNGSKEKAFIPSFLQLLLIEGFLWASVLRAEEIGTRLNPDRSPILAVESVCARRSIVSDSL